jgi:membrane protein DedA with SNARE-associated domain
MLLAEDFATHYMHVAEPYIKQWGLLAVGGGILCETLLIAGFFVPGFAILITSGMMAAQGSLSPWQTIAAGIAGGFIGDQVAYAVGYLMGDRLLHNQPGALKKLGDAFTKKGGYILLWFHIVGPLRMVIPCVAGSLRFSFLRWLVLDTIGLVLWILFGFYLGWFTVGPLKRYGAIASYVIFGAVILLIVYTLWKIVELFIRREKPRDLLEDEAELAAESLARLEGSDET